MAKEQDWKTDPSDRVGAQDQSTKDAGEALGTTSKSPPSSTVPPPELQMDIEQVVEVTNDQGWGEEGTILGDSASHDIDTEIEEGNDSSSDCNAEERSTETDMTHLHENTTAQASSPSPPRQATRKRSRNRRKGRRQQGDGVGRVREAEKNLPLRSYCSQRQVHRDMRVVLYLVSPVRQDGLRYEDFDRCSTPLECERIGGRCTGCIARGGVSEQDSALVGRGRDCSGSKRCG